MRSALLSLAIFAALAAGCGQSHGHLYDQCTTDSECKHDAGYGGIDDHVCQEIPNAPGTSVCSRPCIVAPNVFDVTVNQCVPQTAPTGKCTEEGREGCCSVQWIVPVGSGQQAKGHCMPPK